MNPNSRLDERDLRKLFGLQRLHATVRPKRVDDEAFWAWLEAGTAGDDDQIRRARERRALKSLLGPNDVLRRLG